MIRAAALTIVVAAAAPAAAPAATVHMSSTPQPVGRDSVGQVPVVVVTAAPGEHNDVTIGWGPANDPRSTDPALVVADVASPLVAGRGCVRTEAGVSCPVPSSYARAQVDLGDGDDRLTFTGTFSVVDVLGGPGDDRVDATRTAYADLDGGDGDDVLLTGTRDDVLTGGAGADRLSGGPGNDTLTGGPGADAISGGDDVDTVSYADHATGVTVHMDGSAAAGSPGEGDTLAPDLEHAIGGAGDDALIGTDGPNLLRGNGGDDLVEGRGGDDDLRGDEGVAYVAPDTDMVLGGDGDDRIASVGRDSQLEGGAGTDAITTIGPVLVRPGPGRDFVRALGGGVTVFAGEDDGAVDLVRCTRGTARHVELGDGDFSDGCGPDVRQEQLRAFALLSAAPEVWAAPTLDGGLDLTCADAMRPRCAVRLSIRDEKSGRVLVAWRETLRPGTRHALEHPIPRRFALGRIRIVSYAVSLRTPSGEVQTLRWRAWIPRGSTQPTDGILPGRPDPLA